MPSCWICFVRSLLFCMPIWLVPSISVAGVVVVSFVPIVVHPRTAANQRRQPSKTSSNILRSSSRQQLQEKDNPVQQPQHQPTIIVVGKIIVDEYGDPNNQSRCPQATTLSVGGGGPQAAMGAALALAALSLYNNDDLELEMDDDTTSSSSSRPLPQLPPKQPVAFMAAVGDIDFSRVEEESLREMLRPALLYEPRLLRGQHFMTPRIRLWHDDNQMLQWYALNDSFGPAGAGGLWSELPRVDDYLSLLDEINEKSNQHEETTTCATRKPILHVIAECGKDAPGTNGDSRALLDARLRNSISYLGVEPILFPQPENGEFCKDNANHCAKLLQRIIICMNTTPPPNIEDADNSPPLPPLVISPDMAAFKALQERCTNSPTTTACLSSSLLCDVVTWAVRHGPNGSQIIQPSSSTLSSSNTAPTNFTVLKVPAATLNELVNPTGAGNAFAAAFTALLGSGCNVTTSACLATGVGAVFCEYNHCPPYTWQVIRRVVEASREVRMKLSKL